jgi:hypothetical protein
MFKNASSEAEIMEIMGKNLVSQELEETYKFNKIAKAIEYLAAAADIFDDAEMTEEAAEVTDILESLTK